MEQKNNIGDWFGLLAGLVSVGVAIYIIFG